MKKIMFNDKYGLTQAVLEGRKTQTRRISNIQPPYKKSEIAFPIFEDDGIDNPLYGAYCWVNKDNSEEYTEWIKPHFKDGEIVAVAQSYKTIDDYYKSAYSYNHSSHGMTICEFDGVSDKDVHEWNMIAVNYRGKKSWTNKLFVKPELMLHFIRITNVRIERLHDISDNDCLAEGIEFDGKAQSFYCGFNSSTNSKIWLGDTPREAYSSLIDKVGKKGDWDSNPYVFVYDFELIK